MYPRGQIAKIHWDIKFTLEWKVYIEMESIHFTLHVQVYNVVGWRVIAATASVYVGLYGYERLKYTERAMERRYKQQVL